jgi:hypothetical protein
VATPHRNMRTQLEALSYEDSTTQSSNNFPIPRISCALNRGGKVQTSLGDLLLCSLAHGINCSMRPQREGLRVVREEKHQTENP